MYNKKTIINGQNVELSKEEQKGVTNFHRSRIAFAVIEKENDYVIALNIKDQREHRVYLKEDFDIDDEQFENLIRGYIKPGKINFYISSHFYQVPKEKLSDELLNDIKNIALNVYGDGDYVIGNGVHVGRPGEEWDPIEVIKAINLKR